MTVNLIDDVLDVTNPHPVDTLPASWLDAAGLCADQLTAPFEVAVTGNGDGGELHLTDSCWVVQRDDDLAEWRSPSLWDAAAGTWCCTNGAPGSLTVADRADLLHRAVALARIWAAAQPLMTAPATVPGVFHRDWADAALDMVTTCSQQDPRRRFAAVVGPLLEAFNAHQRTVGVSVGHPVVAPRRTAGLLEAGGQLDLATGYVVGVFTPGVVRRFSCDHVWPREVAAADIDLFLTASLRARRSLSMRKAFPAAHSIV